MGDPKRATAYLHKQRPRRIFYHGWFQASSNGITYHWRRSKRPTESRLVKRNIWN